MSRAPISSKGVPGVGYRHTRLQLKDFKPTSHWLVISENLGRNHQVGETTIYVPDAKNATMGLVEAVGPEAEEVGIKVGDKVMYEAWRGGRWAFTVASFEGKYLPGTCDVPAEDIMKVKYEELECLIISLDAIWAII